MLQSSAASQQGAGLTRGLADQVVKEAGGSYVSTLVSGALENGCKASGNDNGALREGPAESIMLVWAYAIDLAFIETKCNNRKRATTDAAVINSDNTVIE